MEYIFVQLSLQRNHEPQRGIEIGANRGCTSKLQRCLVNLMVGVLLVITTTGVDSCSNGGSSIDRGADNKCESAEDVGKWRERIFGGGSSFIEYCRDKGGYYDWVPSKTD